MSLITNKSYVKRENDIPYKEIEKEGILLRLKDGDYFAVNEVGLFIWKLLNKPKTLKQIAERISSRYYVNKTVVLSDLFKFIKVLCHKKLVLICESKRD